MAVRLVIEDDEGSTTVVPLGLKPITIGRAEGNTVRLTERNVSREHARLATDADGSWFIEDLQSYNGLRVNGRRVDGRAPLREGDIVRIGDYMLSLRGQAVTSPELAANETTQAGVHQAAATHPAAATVVTATVAQLGQRASHMVGAPSPSRGLPLIPLLTLLGAIVAVAIVLVWTLRGSQERADMVAVEPRLPTGVPAPSMDPPPSLPTPVVAEGPTALVDVEAVVTAEPAAVEDEPPAKELPVAEEPIVRTPVTKKAPARAHAPKPPMPPPAPVDPEALLTEARGELFRHPAKAYRLASKSYQARPTQDAAIVMVSAACRMGDAAKATQAMSGVKGEGERASMTKACAAKGIEL